MRQLEQPISEIRDYISNLKLSTPLLVMPEDQAFFQAYRYVHGLLIWNECLTATIEKPPSREAVLQYQELISDLASTQFLLLTGFYKPARMMLRSSIENIIRVAFIEQGFLQTAAKFTHELIGLVRSSPAGNSSSPVFKDLNAILEIYSNLCSFTHACDLSHLALRLPISRINEFEKNQYLSILKDLRELAMRYNRILAFLYFQKLDSLRHKDRDFVLDLLPRGLKRALTSD